jgi:hypothetical protein
VLADPDCSEQNPFQRGWVWPLENIRSLLASVSLGYPVGTVMMLRTGGEVRFKQRPIEGVTAAGNAERLILDGQQRLTSLFQALKLGQPIETQDARKRRVSVSHAANPAFMLKDDFDGFIADRRRRLLRMISDAMGKRADETLGESVIEPAEADEDLHDA